MCLGANGLITVFGGTRVAENKRKDSWETGRDTPEVSGTRLTRRRRHRAVLFRHTVMVVVAGR